MAAPAAEAPLASLPADHPAQAYAALPARELIRAVQLAGQNQAHPESQVIFAAFYYRYYPYLMTVVSNQLGFLTDRSGIPEIIHDAFRAFFEKCARFDRLLAPDDAACDMNIRSYLARLARWKASDARSFQKSFGADAVAPADFETLLNQSSPLPVRDATEADPPQASLVSVWIDSLPPMHADVLRTYFLDDHAGQKSDRLPEGIARALAEKYQTTTSNIRHIKLKLLREMRERFAPLVEKSDAQA